MKVTMSSFLADFALVFNGYVYLNCNVQINKIINTIIQICNNNGFHVVNQYVVIPRNQTNVSINIVRNKRIYNSFFIY